MPALAEEPSGHFDDLVTPEVPDDLFEVVGRSARRPSRPTQRAAGGKATGMCFTPLMNCDWRRSHLAVEPDVGHPVEQVLEHHPDLHAGQVGPQAEVGTTGAEGHVGVGVAGDVEDLRVIEDGLVAVGRDVEEHHLGVGLDGLAAELEVLSGLAPEVHDRGHVAQHLLDGRRQERAVVAEQFPLVGIVEEGGHPPRDQISGGLVAGHGEEEEEQLELHVGELLPVDVHAGQHAHQVVVGIGPLGGEQLGGVGVQLHGRLWRFLLAGLVLGILVADHPVGPVEHPVPVLVGHAEELGDDHQG